MRMQVCSIARAFWGVYTDDKFLSFLQHLPQVC